MKKRVPIYTNSWFYTFVIFCISTLCIKSFGNVPADVWVNGGSTANLTVSIIIGDPPDTETSVDSEVVSVDGFGHVEFSPDQEPFTSVGLNQLQFFLGNASLDYEVLCGSFIGCQDINLNLTNISATLVNPIGASLTETGHADFGSTWRLQADYVVTSFLFNSSGVIDTNSESGFGATFNASNGSVFIHEMFLGSIFGEVPNDFGFTIMLQTDVDLDGTTMSGSYEAHYGACCYENGICQESTYVSTCTSNNGNYFGDGSNCDDYICAPAVCGSGGSCGDIHGPGCNDMSCCMTICDIDYDCCEFGWDAACAVLAVELCGAIPGNDYCDSAYQIGLERVPFTTINSSTDGPVLITECASPDSGQYFVNDVWFSHIPEANNGVAVSTCGHSNFDTRLAVYDACNGQLIACADDTQGCPDGTSQLCFYGEEGQEYLIRVGGSSGWGSGELDISWCDVTSPPVSLAVEWSTKIGGNGHWYAMYSLGDEATYQMALDAAEHFGGTVATITSEEEQQFITNQMPAHMAGGVTAIGLFQSPSGEEPSGGWQWVTGEPLKWSNWANGEPNDFGDEDFAMMYPDGTWNDGANEFGHVLLEFDSNPSLGEVTWETSEGGNGHTYQGVIFPERITWEQARTYAKKQGGSLVSFETQEEASWVFDELGSFTSLWSMTYLNSGPWIGLYKDMDGWRWLSEEPLDWNGWAPAEPNDTGDRAAMFGSSRFFDNVVNPLDGGETFGTAQFVDDFGFSRLKLVSDSFQGVWGTWISDSIPQEVIGLNVSFRFSFKNEDGGPGDGFSILWGDLSDTSNGRASGGEWGINAFEEDDAGLSVCARSYPPLGENGVAGRWGTTEFAFNSLDFSTVTYNDYQKAVDPNNMATMNIYWSKSLGVTVSVAFPSNNPDIIWEEQGASFFDEVDATNWNFGFAARNGGIDMDVLIGDLIVGYEFIPEINNISGGPRNTFDDTYNDNVRRSIIIEYDSVINTCLGDLDEDGVVGVADILWLIGEWGICDDPESCTADLDDDGVVGVGDILVLIALWGDC